MSEERGIINFENVSRSLRHDMGKLIRLARDEIGMSQARLAELLGRRQAYVSDLETGKTEPNATTLVQLSYFLRKPVAYFFPANMRDIGPFLDKGYTEPTPIAWEGLTLEERELIQRLREVQPHFDYHLAMHLLRSLIDYDERVGAFVDNEP